MKCTGSGLAWGLFSSSYVPTIELATWGFNVNSKLADRGLDSGTDRLLT
jgi:hypothetical protein